MILYSEIYEREGNDAWLIDYVEIHKNIIGFYLEHKVRWSGWNGDLKEDYTIELDDSDLEKSQKIIDEYIEHHSLWRVFPNGEQAGIKIDLKTIIQ
jgi:hypothetical protein